MRVAFICDLPQEHLPFWNDGLKAALGVLEKKHGWQVDIVNRPDISTLVEQSRNQDPVLGLYDVGLFWMGLSNPYTNLRIFKKQALLFAGGTTFTPSVHNFDLIFAESMVDFKDFKRFGKKVIQAFGTNTELFKPMPEQPKIFKYIYPAAFAKWKHHEKFAEYVNNNRVARLDSDNKSEYITKPSLAVGYMQPDEWERECYDVCQKYGIAVLPQVDYSVMPYLINSAENVYVGADINGGCQRTILEAKACRVPVIVDSDSPKLLELEKLTYEDILKDWSEESYAKKIKEGISNIL